MDILVVCHYGLYSDPEISFVHPQLREMVRLGHSVRVILPNAWGKRDVSGKRLSSHLNIRQVDGVTLYDLRYLSFSKYGGKSLNRHMATASLAGVISRVLEDFQPNVIYAHTVGFDSGIGAWLQKKTHAPLVITTHGSDTSVPFEKGEFAWLQASCKDAKTVVAVSSKLADRLRQAGVDVPIRSILNGFRLPKALPNEAERVPYSVIFVGHLLHQKRVAVTIEAFAEFHEKYPQAVLTIIGQGPERSRLEALCAELHIADCVHFRGEIPNAEVLTSMARSSFFVMPSVREGFGIVYLEAMASGCVTIGTEGEGITDFIRHGENGLLVPPDEPKRICELMAWYQEHPLQADAIRRQAQTDARSLTWRKNAEQYIALFRSL